MAYISLNPKGLTPLFENMHHVYNALLALDACDIGRDLYKETKALNGKAEDNYQRLLFQEIKQGIEKLNHKAVITFKVQGLSSCIYYSGGEKKLTGIEDLYRALEA